jgi:hypothetical protein
VRRLLLVLVGAALVAYPARVSQEPLTPTVLLPAAQVVVDSGPALVREVPRVPRHLHLWRFDAPVVPLTLVGNELVPPSDPTTLGWWGQPVGALHGATVLTGHTVHDGGGTFDDLEDTPEGARAMVSGARYVVTRVRVISKAALARAATRLFRQDGPHRLILVTCEGYDPTTGHYSSNVVVTLRLK